MHNEYIQRLEKRFGKENASKWFYTLCGFLYQMQEYRDSFISEFEESYRLIPGINLTGKEERPFSNEEISRLLNSEEVNLIKDFLEDQNLLEIKTLEEFNQDIENKRILDSSYDKDVTKDVEIICHFGNKKTILGEDSGIIFLKNYFDKNGVFVKGVKNNAISQICEIKESEYDDILKYISGDLSKIPRLFSVILKRSNL